ncbi:RHS repeat domain-containing protein [Pseudomonas akapageensis]|uniref:RHS repeat domain-containing protein n=1 Tax=Pseudomonas akapageensis TaxID=2609961 RepID=UPI00140E5860|nr:RHS repeat-associated core domain-containing protein [Pseudomonas akapageensis]
MTTSTVVHSNAFNFLSFLQNSVDPRTGQYTVRIELPELHCNDLCGPALPLQLAFNPLNILDSGFGRGWNLNLSQFTPPDSMLALHTGETFKVTGSGEQPSIREKKLDSFHFHNDGNDTYRVVHKSGLVEILQTLGSGADRVALPSRIHSPSGHWISLHYADYQGKPCLASIKDASEQTLLQIDRPSDSSMILQLHPFAGPGGTPLARYEVKLTGRQVREIVLPTAERASWRFDYVQVRGLTCIKEVQTPVGGRELVEYNDNGHAFPGNSGRQALPRVTRHEILPGFDQPRMEVRYTYTIENFLGNNSSIGWSDDGLDNLYKVSGNYSYGSIASHLVDGRVVRSVVCSFNRFHLLTEEITSQGECIQRQRTTYHALDVPFDQQPPYFQLPWTSEQRWEQANSPDRVRSEVATTVYDDYGNLLEETQANGVRTVNEYHPLEGDDDSPPDPDNFVRHLRSQTVHPAANGEGQAPVLRKRYDYRLLVPLQGGSGRGGLLLDRETLLQVTGTTETLVQQTVWDYLQTPNNPLLHGRAERQRVTLNGKSTTTDYSYSKVLQGNESVLQTVETLTGFDHDQPLGDGTTRHAQKVVTLQHSLYHGEPLLNRDDNDVEIRYSYDALRRVTRETVAPGTEFEASRTYAYTLTSVLGQQALQEMTDVKGVQTRTAFDGLNRAIGESRQDADGVIQPQAFRQTYAAIYDALGNLVEETEYDWLDELQLPLPRHLEYDDWGQQSCETGPDGVRQFEVTDPIGTSASQGPIVRSWRQGSGATAAISGLTVTWLNLFEKPTRIERFDLDDRRLSLHQYFHDGLGRTAREIDGRDETTQYRYNLFDRMTETTLPDRAVVRRRYAEHSADDLPVLISVNEVVLGEQHFDGLGRMTKSITGGRERTFHYEPGQSQPATVITPSEQTIHYEYLPQLGEEPLQRRLPTGLADYEYDKQNARLLHCEEQGQALTREYFSTGELKREERQQGAETYTMHYRYSLRGRLLGYTDVLEQTQHYRYDSAGRLEFTQLGSTASTFTYDDLGQTASILTEDSASGQRLGIGLQHDEFGRETLRTFDLDGVTQTLAQRYNEVDALVQRTLSEAGDVLRDETYDYDPRGRLQRYDCSGSQPPIDPYGQAISSQIFSFDALDNLTRVRTDFPGGFNMARYSFNNPDPVQLSEVTNSHAAYPPRIDLAYDADGNLIRDEQDRMLDYDALGRLTTVSALPGEDPGSYGYDPLDRIANGGGDQRFYRGDELASQLRGGQGSTFMRGGGNLLAERQGDNTLLLGSDDKSSVLHETGPDQANAIAYSPHGHRSGEQPIGTALGFNGELSEVQTGVYLLGKGYRAYSPALMYFHSPDSWSPFGRGGINAYCYCGGDPVNFVDPTGHMLKSGVVANPMKVPAVLSKQNAGAALKFQPLKDKHVERLYAGGMSLKNYGAHAKNGVSEYDNLMSKVDQKSSLYTELVSARQGLKVARKEAERQYGEFVEGQTFAAQNIGGAGITKVSSDYVKKLPNVYREQMKEDIRELAGYSAKVARLRQPQGVRSGSYLGENDQTNEGKRRR